MRVELTLAGGTADLALEPGHAGVERVLRGGEPIVAPEEVFR